MFKNTLRTMNLIRTLLISGFIIMSLMGVVCAITPPCTLNANNPYHGPIEPGVDMTIMYPTGTYDLWYAELPLKFSSSSAGDYQNWNWKKIPNVVIKANKDLSAYMGLTGDVSSPADWIGEYQESSVGSNVGTITFFVGRSQNVRYATILCSTGGGGGSLTISKKTYHKNDLIEVYYIGSHLFEDDAWVGIIPSSVPHGNERTNDDADIDYETIGSSESGRVEFYAPASGSWDLRMFSSDTATKGKEITSVSFTVS